MSVGVHLPLKLVEPRSSAKLNGPGLAAHLCGECEIGTVTGVVVGLASTRRLATATIGLRDGALPHVADARDLFQDLFALLLKSGKGIRHSASIPIALILSDLQALSTTAKNHPQP
jgi:hypothetical protein